MKSIKTYTRPHLTGDFKNIFKSIFVFPSSKDMTFSLPIYFFFLCLIDKFIKTKGYDLCVCNFRYSEDQQTEMTEKKDHFFSFSFVLQWYNSRIAVIVCLPFIMEIKML